MIHGEDCNDCESPKGAVHESLCQLSSQFSMTQLGCRKSHLHGFHGQAVNIVIFEPLRDNKLPSTYHDVVGDSLLRLAVPLCGRISASD